MHDALAHVLHSLLSSPRRRTHDAGPGVTTERLNLTAFVVAAALSMGCAHSYGLDRRREGGSIPSTAFAYVAMPEAGRFQARTYAESGAQTQMAIAAAIAPHVARVWLGLEVEDRDAALVSARGAGASHAVLSRIDHWEDRATEWSGRRDRMVPG